MIEADFIAVRTSSFSLARIWRPYTLAEERDYVYLDKAKIEAAPELLRLLKQITAGAATGRRAFAAAPPPPAREPATRRPRPRHRIPLDVVAERQAKCDACSENSAGTCLLQKRLSGKRSDIAVGVRMANAHCPKDPPEWESWRPATAD